MEVAQLLGLQGLGNTKCAGMMVASGTGAMALLVSSSSLWQLAFKGPPLLVLHCRLAQQALKGLPVAGVLLYLKGHPLWGLSLLINFMH